MPFLSVRIFLQNLLINKIKIFNFFKKTLAKSIAL